MLADEIDDLFGLLAGRTNFASQGNCSYSTLLYVMGVIVFIDRSMMSRGIHSLYLIIDGFASESCLFFCHIDGGGGVCGVFIVVEGIYFAQMR